MMDFLRAAGNRLRAALPGWWDFHVYGGIVLIGTGFWWIYPPAGVIVGGALLCALGVWFLERAE